jgi:beta-glucanase (GH16 family)
MTFPCRPDLYPHSMKRWLTLVIWILLASLVRAEDVGIWKLVWSDEFNGKTLDPKKWSFEVNADGGGNHELQYYITNNVTVTNGLLKITAKREHYAGLGGTREYTSSRIRTLHQGEWRYGRFEMRARLPEGRGLWPAFWLLPTDERYGGWPHSGEVDLMELVGHRPDTVHGTLHYAGPDGRHTYRGTNYVLPSGKFSDAFHIFRTDWEQDVFRWYVDGELYQTQTNWPSDAGAMPKPFDQRFHLLLNLAVGGAWPGSPEAATRFPQTFEIDWVRVYQHPEPKK